MSKETEHEGAPEPHTPPMRDAVTARAGWRKLLDIDWIFKWLTLLILPAFVIHPGFKSQVSILYLCLFVLKVWKNGYRKCGLEWVIGLAVLGVAVSAIDAIPGHHSILDNVRRLAQLIALPLLMCQYKPLRGLDRTLACLFTCLAAYGLIRINAAPLVSGYSDREYCFLDFYMHSSVVAFSGFVFFAVTLIKRPGLSWKVLSTVNLLIFLYLIIVHGVRASYVTVLVLTPVILILEYGKQALVKGALLLTVGAVLLGGLCLVSPRTGATMKERVTSIVDLQQGSNQGRVLLWRKAMEVFARHPVNGIGYRRFNRMDVTDPEIDDSPYGYAFWHAHNEWLGFLAETGIIGFVAWLAFKLRLLHILFLGRRNWVGAFLLYLLLGFEIHNMFEVYLVERIAYIYMYVLLGLGLNQLISAGDAPPQRVTPS